MITAERRVRPWRHVLFLTESRIHWQVSVSHNVGLPHNHQPQQNRRRTKLSLPFRILSKQDAAARLTVCLVLFLTTTTIALKLTTRDILTTDRPGERVSECVGFNVPLDT